MLYATIFTNHDRGYGFASKYTISATCKTLLNDRIYTATKDLNARSEKIIKITYQTSGANEECLLIKGAN